MEVLVFDMGHVFIDFEWDVVSKGFCDATGRTMEELRAGFRHVAQLGYESGQVTTAQFLEELNRYLSADISLDQFKQLWTVTFRENEEMAQLLSTLKELRPLYLLSNTNEIHFQHLQSTFNVTRHFTDVVLSYEVGCSKPDPDIYREVLRRCCLPAEKCLFIDDLKCNVEAAQELGMQAILFRGPAQLKEELTQRGFAL